MCLSCAIRQWALLSQEGSAQSVVLQGFSSSRTCGLPIPVTWEASKNPDAQALPGIGESRMGWGGDSISNLLSPLEIPGDGHHGEPLVWGPEVRGERSPTEAKTSAPPVQTAQV